MCQKINNPEEEFFAMQKVPCIGPSHWKRFFNVDCVPSSIEGQVAQDIEKYLQSDCPFTPDKKVRDTHIVMFLPKEQFSLERWRILTASRSTGFDLKGSDRFWGAPAMIADRGHDFGWYLFYRGVIPGSLNKTWKQQLEIMPSGYVPIKSCEVASLHFMTTWADNLVDVMLNTAKLYGRVAEHIEGNVILGEYFINQLKFSSISPLKKDWHCGIYTKKKLLP